MKCSYCGEAKCEDEARCFELERLDNRDNREEQERERRHARQLRRILGTNNPPRNR